MERINCDAYYTSRVDDDGHEIERTHTARTMDMPPRTTHSNISSCESARSVQHVNSAVYVEKNSGKSQCGSVLSLPSLANSDIVPPLDLQSEENFPTRRDGYTFSYRDHYDHVKLNGSPDVAYNNWLSAKRKIISNEAARRKKEEQQKAQLQEERKQLAEAKYHKWLMAKQEAKLKAKEQSEKAAKNKKLDELQAKEKLKEWERKKREQEERRREMLRMEEEERKQNEKKRRELAEEAWKKWIAEAPFKPKPVPLNQGLDTLRGTISQIFINPNEWKTD